MQGLAKLETASLLRRNLAIIAVLFIKSMGRVPIKFNARKERFDNLFKRQQHHTDFDITHTRGIR